MPTYRIVRIIFETAAQAGRHINGGGSRLKRENMSRLLIGGILVAVVIGVQKPGKVHLAQIAGTNDTLGVRFSAAERRQEQSSKNSYNRNDDQQFNERKAAAIVARVCAKENVTIHIGIHVTSLEAARHGKTGVRDSLIQ